MKITNAWLRVKKYTDDEGKPICGNCFVSSPCEYYKDIEIPSSKIIHEPGSKCPIWSENCGNPYRWNAPEEALKEYLSRDEYTGFIAGFNAARELKEE